MAKEKVSLTIEKGLWQEFHKYCNDHAFNLSGKVELLIRDELLRAKKRATAYDKVIDMLNSIASRKARARRKKEEKKEPPREKPPSLEFLRERMIERRKAFTRKKKA